ncbi:hypothetical protein GCM10007857_57620 [Bradyrhizobium iriomotense]|uniref:Uncharacterized protein n=1 Tax=Bradyrhizobium iriomotense TaxID=441950 RepID=A0ABQ6B3P7_9BRAD|nr:hypothetical protein GCM10007857_57620 [Bradyrhizobium iriomotense]
MIARLACQLDVSGEGDIPQDAVLAALKVDSQPTFIWSADRTRTEIDDTIPLHIARPRPSRRGPEEGLSCESETGV